MFPFVLFSYCLVTSVRQIKEDSLGSKMYHTFHSAKIPSFRCSIGGERCSVLVSESANHLYMDIANVVGETSSKIKHSISSSPFKLVSFDGVILVIKLRS